jgi:hypothetical protein
VPALPSIDVDTVGDYCQRRVSVSAGACIDRLRAVSVPRDGSSANYLFWVRDFVTRRRASLMSHSKLSRKTHKQEIG